MELFDMVKAAPPPKTISAPERTTPPTPIPPDSPDALVAGAADDDDDDLLESVKINDEESDAEPSEDNNQRKDSARRQIDSPPLAKHKVSEKPSTKKAVNSRKDKKDINKITDAKTEEDDDDDGDRTAAGRSKDAEESDESSNGYPRTLPAPTKTKAQQKMFSDLLDQSASRRTAGTAPELRIRIRRLTQSEIDSASASLAKSKFASPGSRKRGRPRKSGDDKKSPSPAKKLKATSPPKVHIKVPLQSGATKRALANLARTHTPPPILSSRPKPKQRPRPKFYSKCPPRGLKPSPAMIRRYGKRVFSCVVKVKNLKWPRKSPERRQRFGGAHKDRPRRSNLSVSFNESVEILGISESGSRRSTFGTISSKSPKPTRLQRVDATGNVLEDIVLTSNTIWSGNSPSASTSRGKGKRRSCNGAPQLKRPHQRIPLSGLASLRLDDGPKSDDDDGDEEYIVPNELPGMQRPGTPTPRKKKISYTTTVSDDEDVKAPPKKSKDANAPKKEPKSKPNPKKVEKTTSLKESVLQNVILQGKSNDVVKETELTEAAVVLGQDDQVAEPEVQNVAEAATNEETDGGKPETPNAVDMAEDNPQEEGGTAEETDAVAGEKSVEENGEEKTEEEPKASVEENGEQNPEEESKANNAEQTAADATETLDMAALEVEEASCQNVRDDKAEPEQVDDVEDFRELETPLPQPVPPTTEENPEDVLEIQTSLDDVRQLHTPFSSQQSTPQASKRVRLDSGDSDCSFKSANGANKEVMLGHVDAEEGEAAGKEDATVGGDKSESDRVVVTTPPPSTPRTVNGCDPVTSGGSSITTVFYSPIETMPTLDDEVLGQLVEPDFQLNSSRHAISRGTLDDIMTALES